MSIDWFTFSAQIVNFLLLVALLRWLLYDPVVRAMNAREKKISDRLNEAEQNRGRAAEEAAQYREKTHQLQQDRERLLHEAKEDANRERERLVREAREEVDRQRAQWQQVLRRDQEDLIAELRRKAAHLGLQAASRTLSQLADEDLERQMYESFTARFERLPRPQVEELRHHLTDGDTDIVCHSSFEVPGDQRERLTETIQRVIGTEAQVVFDVTPDLICGIELDVGGYSYGWNAKDFLRDLEFEFGERLKHELQ